MDILAKTIIDNIVKKTNKYESNINLEANQSNLSNYEESLLKRVINKEKTIDSNVITINGLISKEKNKSNNKDIKENKTNEEIKISLQELCNRVLKNKRVDENEESNISNKDGFNTVSLNSLWKK